MRDKNYAASKAGMTGMTKALAQGCLRNITANCVALDLLQPPRRTFWKICKKRPFWVLPAGRLGEPEDVASCVVSGKSEVYIQAKHFM